MPKTWEEFRDVADFFTRRQEKRYGCAILSGREYDSIVMGLQQFIWDWGGSWGDPKTMKVEGVLNTIDSTKGLNIAKELMSFSPQGGENFSYDKTIEAMEKWLGGDGDGLFRVFPGHQQSDGRQGGLFHRSQP